MLVDKDGQLWKCDDKLNNVELIPDIKVKLTSLISDQSLALTTDGAIVNVNNGRISHRNNYKSVHYIHHNIKLVVTQCDEALILNGSGIVKIITDIQLVVGSYHNIRILTNYGKWFRLDNLSLVIVNDLPPFNDIIKVKDNLILTSDKLYDINESQIYPVTFKVSDICSYNFGSMISSSNSIVIDDSGRVYIGCIDELVEFDNQLIKDLNYISQWRHCYCFIINGEYNNLLISESGQAYIISDEYGSIRTTNIPAELYRS